MPKRGRNYGQGGQYDALTLAPGGPRGRGKNAPTGNLLGLFPPSDLQTRPWEKHDIAVSVRVTARLPSKTVEISVLNDALVLLGWDADEPALGRRSLVLCALDDSGAGLAFKFDPTATRNRKPEIIPKKGSEPRRKWFRLCPRASGFVVDKGNGSLAVASSVDVRLGFVADSRPTKNDANAFAILLERLLEGDGDATELPVEVSCSKVLATARMLGGSRAAFDFAEMARAAAGGDARRSALRRTSAATRTTTTTTTTTTTVRTTAASARKRIKMSPPMAHSGRESLSSVGSAEDGDDLTMDELEDSVLFASDEHDAPPVRVVPKRSANDLFRATASSATQRRRQSTASGSLRGRGKRMVAAAAGKKAQLLQRRRQQQQLSSRQQRTNGKNPFAKTSGGSSAKQPPLSALLSSKKKGRIGGGSGGSGGGGGGGGGGGSGNTVSTYFLKTQKNMGSWRSGSSARYAPIPFL